MRRPSERKVSGFSRTSESHPHADVELRERERFDAEHFSEPVSHVNVGPAGGDANPGDELGHRPERAFLAGIDEAIRSAEHDEHRIADIAKRSLGDRALNVEHAWSPANIRTE